MSPFQALYGRTPPAIPCYTRTSSSVQAVDDILTQRDQLLRTLKRNLQEAQQRMTCKAKAHRRDFKFSVGDLVLLRLQPYRQSTVAARHSHKLSKRFYGPFPALARIGQVAYQLGLLESSRIHPVFHISVLKPFRGAHSLPHQSLPPFVVDNHPIDLPLAICAFRSILRNGQTFQQILVQWTGCPLEDAAWEDFAEFSKLYPSYHLEDKVNFKAGGNDTLPLSLESNAEISKEGKVAERSEDLIVEAHSDKEDARPKRVTKKPTYLKDYV